MNAEQLVALRRKLGLTQTQFWEPLGITQSGGSRYETGRNVPPPMKLLIKLAYAPPVKAGDALRNLRRHWEQQ